MRISVVIISLFLVLSFKFYCNDSLAMSIKTKELEGKLIYTNSQDIYIFNFSSMRKTRIYSLPKEEKKNLGSISGVCWSPDGKYIVFSKNRQIGGENFLHIITEKGIEVREIRKEGLSMLYPSWSPDNHKISFVVQNESYQGLYIADVTNLNIHRISNLRPAKIEPKWSPDSKKIVFVVEKKSMIGRKIIYYNEIFLVDFDGNNLRKLTEGSRPIWLSLNKIIYLGKNGFYTIDVDGKNNTKILSLPKFTGGVDSVALSRGRTHIICHTYTPDLGPFPQDGFHIFSLKSFHRKIKFGLFSGMVHSMSWE